MISTKTTAVRNMKDMLFILPNIIFHNICCLMHTKTCSICLTIRKYILDSAQFSSVIEIIQRMEQNPNYSYIHICELLTILSSYKNTEKKKVSEKHRTIDLILEYINKNYQTVQNLDDISDAVHISKPHLCKLFKQEMNITVSDYLNTVRINNACEFLRNSKHSITDIATACRL